MTAKWKRRAGPGWSERILETMEKRLMSFGAEIVAGVEIERRGSPEGPPSAGDRLRAGAVLGGEQGDDGAEDGIREFADVVAVSNEIIMADEIAVARPFPWPAPGGSTGCATLGCRHRRRRRRLLLHVRRLPRRIG